MKYFSIVVLALFSTVVQSPLRATTIYDVANDFSVASDPNGVWSYGYTTTLGGSFTLFNLEGTSNGVDYWTVGAGVPLALHNPQNFASGLFAAGVFGMHPGASDEKAVARFTAPLSASYTFATSFSRIDTATTDVHVLVNGVSQFDGTVDGSGGSSYSNTVSLTSGDTLDFAVGYGGNGYAFDMTGVAATITQNSAPQSATPEPATWSMAGLGALAALLARRRLRQ